MGEKDTKIRKKKQNTKKLQKPKLRVEWWWGGVFGGGRLNVARGWRGWRGWGSGVAVGWH